MKWRPRADLFRSLARVSIARIGARRTARNGVRGIENERADNPENEIKTRQTLRVRRSEASWAATGTKAGHSSRGGSPTATSTAGSAPANSYDGARTSARAITGHERV